MLLNLNLNFKVYNLAGFFDQDLIGSWDMNADSDGTDKWLCIRDKTWEDCKVNSNSWNHEINRVCQCKAGKNVVMFILSGPQFILENIFKLLIQTIAHMKI